VPVPVPQPQSGESGTRSVSSGSLSVSGILYSQISDMEFLAAGGFGKVYKATFRGERVAVKIIAASEFSAESLKAFQEEAANCNAIRSRYVVNFIGACLEEPNVALVMELMTGGSLSSLLRSSVELSWVQRLEMLEEIAMGINVLHSNIPTILHRDLKCANVLLDDHKHCHLADFGLAVVKEDSATKTGLTSAGTLAWMAPELFSLRPKFSVKSDIYALGIIMLEIATRTSPYAGVPAEVIKHCVLDGERDEVPAGCPAGYTDLMQQCWAQKPADRPNIGDVIKSILTIKEQYKNN